MCCKALFERVRDTPGVYIHDGHEGATALARHGGDEKAHGTSTDNEGCRARGGRGAIHGVDCN